MIVWLASYPRSGNTFFRVILNSVFDLKTYSVYDDRYDIGADKETSDVVGHVFLPDDSTSMQKNDDAKPGWAMPTATIKKMREDKALYIVKTHELRDEYIQPEDKVIYLLRDGRESTLSFWKYSTDFIASKRTLQDFLSSGEWSSHVASWDPSSLQNTLLVKFEVLIDNPEKMIAEISNFLHVKPTGGAIPSFEELKKVNPKFFRSGQKNSWENIFTQEDHTLYWENNSKEMIKYDYISPLPKGYILDDKKILPKVTIITVSYNAKNDIERTIKSVLEQTLPNVEYIIMDGGSTDGTVDIIKKYGDKISYWISEPDNGIYDAMNKAIDLANGDWINFLNAGDTFVDNDTIANFVNQIAGDGEIYYGSRYLHRGKEQTLEEPADIDDFYQTMPFGHQAAFVKKTLLKKYKFDLSYKLSSDYDFFIKCYKNNCNFHNLNFPICHFSVDGLSYKFRFKSLLETLKVLSDYTEESIVKKSVFYKAFQNTTVSDRIDPANVFINNTNKFIGFTIQPKLKDVQIAFYLFKDGKRIDTQWYSKNFSYKLNKQEHGKGRYKIQYFLVNAKHINPGEAEDKDIGFSKIIELY